MKQTDPKPDHLEATEREYLQRLQENQRAIQTSISLYLAHLSQRYQLTPEDRLEDDGRIVRQNGAGDASP